VVTTVAGTGVDCSGTAACGDGGQATSAAIGGPLAVAIDGLGNLYLAHGPRVRRVDPTGTISTVAGTGNYGASGEGVLATTATFGEITGLAVDGLGQLYIGDSMNRRVRRVDLDGIITTVAGNGTACSSSTAACGDGGVATSAQVTPSGIGVDAQNHLLICDRGINRVRKVDANGVITTVAGTGVSGGSGDGEPATLAQLSAPDGVAFDGAGNYYIAEGFRVRKVTPMGTISTIAGNGQFQISGDGGFAVDAGLGSVAAVAADRDGNVFLSETANSHRVRRIDVTTGIIDSFAGTHSATYSGSGGAATSALLARPQGLAFDSSGNLYLADHEFARVRRVDPAGTITTIAGTGAFGFSGDGGLATAARLRGPSSVAVDANGVLYIADGMENRVRRVDAAGVITTFAGNGTSAYGGDGGPATSAGICWPSGLAFDGQGNLYIASKCNNVIRRVDAAGNISTYAGTHSSGFAGDGGLATLAQLNDPHGIAFDANGNLYIADLGNNRIRRVAPDGIITTVAGSACANPPCALGDGGVATSAYLYQPLDVAVGAGGVLYIAASNGRIRRVDGAGVITTIAGSDASGFAGDGGPATAIAMRDGPYGVAVDASGVVYFADTNNNRVRRISSTGVVTSVVGEVAPRGLGPLATARLADARALAAAGTLTLVAGGTSGTIQAVRDTSVEAVVGRYPHEAATSNLARFRDQTFGDIGGVAYDSTAGKLYVAETSVHRIHVVTVGDPADENTWTIAPLAGGTAGFADGSGPSARFRSPTGLFVDPAAQRLYVADTGNHVIRSIDVSSTNATVTSIAGTPAIRGFFGDASTATDALLFRPQAITRCPNGDLFVADTGNHRVRRIAAGTNVITTVVGVGVPASTGEGRPAFTFPVDSPLGLACDDAGNLFVTSTTTVRLLPRDAAGVVDGTADVLTVYGGPPGDMFPASVTRCLTGLATAGELVKVVDSCTGLLVQIKRE
jgi:sugar lactone lactonase YvrE